MANTTKFGFGPKANVPTALEENKLDEFDMIVAEDTDELGYVSAEGEAKWFKERLGEDVTVNGVTGLGIANGGKLTANMTVLQAIKALVQKAVPATYTRPTVSLANNGGQASGAVEAGTSVTPKLRATFTKNDAGDLTSIKIQKGSEDVETGVASPLDYDGSPLVIGDETVSFKAVADYKEGPIKNNNLGQPSPDGHITAGSVTSSGYNIVGQRNLFYGTGVGELPELNSATIRGLANKKLNPTQGYVFNINIAVGQQYVIFAYKNTLRDVNQVMYVETNDTGMASSFSKTEVSVEGAGGFTGTPYKVYTYRMAAPAAAPMTFKVTI